MTSWKRLRLRALRGCELGLTEVQVASASSVSPAQTVCRLVGRLRRGHGVPAATAPLRAPAGFGPRFLLRRPRPNTSSNSYAPISPKNWASRPPLWTRRAVRDLIRKEFDLDLAERTVGRYLKRWQGFTAKRLQRPRHARDQDPEEVQRWLEETYPAIEAPRPTEKGRKSIGVTRSAWPRTNSLHGEAMRPRGKPRPRMCRTRTSERTKSRRSRTTARFGS